MEDKNYISEYAKVSKGVLLKSPVRLYGTVNIQSNSCIEAFTFVNSRTTIAPNTRIGKYCSIGKIIEIGAISHPVEWLSSSPFQYNMVFHFPELSEKFPQKYFDRPMETIIGNDVWIDSLSIVLRGVHISDGAIIKARSVVVDNVPPYAIVEGVPAKIIGYRFEKKIIKKLLKLRWWDMDYRKLKGISFDNIEIAVNQLEEIIELSSNIKKEDI